MLEIQKFLENFSINDLKEKFSIQVKQHPNYSNLLLFNYSQVDSPFKELIVRESRGLILDSSDNWKIINFPYLKFFNYGEGKDFCSNFNFSNYKIYEKLDGTLVSLWYYDDKWHVSTKGMPDAGGKVNNKIDLIFNELFWHVFDELKYNTGVLHKDYNYFFELCTPHNQVIVKHKYNNLVLHGARNRLNGQEINPTNIEALTDTFNIVKELNFKDLNEVLKVSQHLDGIKDEGFILVDDSFNRLKIKSPNYVNLAYLKNSTNNIKTLIKIIVNNESSEFLTYFPDIKPEYTRLLDLYTKLLLRLHFLHFQFNNIESQKEFAVQIKDIKERSILFFLRKNPQFSIRESLTKLKIETIISLMEC
jgi:hypothetical protein